MEDKENSFELIESHDAMKLVPKSEVQGWWLLAVAASIILLVLLWLFLKRKKSIHDPTRDRREAYEAAKKDFGKMEHTGARDAAMKVSLALRSYLARSLGEPALYETQEEFVGRNDGLKNLPEDVKTDITEFFAKLAAVKYAPEEDVEMTADETVTQGSELLERIHHS